MFTGIVTAVGRVSAVARNGGKGRGRGNGEGVNGLLLTIRAPYKGLKPGESIAVNGACLTVERVVRGGFTVHAVETRRPVAYSPNSVRPVVVSTAWTSSARCAR